MAGQKQIESNVSKNGVTKKTIVRLRGEKKSFTALISFLFVSMEVGKERKKEVRMKQKQEQRKNERNACDEKEVERLRCRAEVRQFRVASLAKFVD